MPFLAAEDAHHMPFKRTPEEGSAEPTARRDYVHEVERVRKQEALKFIIDSGRAATPEEAERYLESVNRFRERLISFLKEEVPRRWPRAENQEMRKPQILRALGHTHREFVEPSDVAALKPEYIDRSDPRLWSLGLTVTPEWGIPRLESPTPEPPDVPPGGYGYEAALRIPRTFDSPDHWDLLVKAEETAKWLINSGYFSREEIAFIARDFKYAVQELAGRLRQVADVVESGRHSQYWGEWDDFLKDNEDYNREAGP